MSRVRSKNNAIIDESNEQSITLKVTQIIISRKKGINIS